MITLSDNLTSITFIIVSCQESYYLFIYFPIKELHMLVYTSHLFNQRYQEIKELIFATRLFYIMWAFHVESGYEGLCYVLIP